MKHRFLFACAAAMALAPSALAQDLSSATERMNAYLDQFSDVVGPGFAVVVVTEDDVLINRVEGLRNAASGAPLTGDTPIYIASQTKAYMGLVAAALDERGILPLDTPIDTWLPGAEWPDNLNAAEFTLRDLLSHQVPFENGTITFLEAYVMRVDPADYADLISQYSEPREAGFQYDNLGYNVYAAILENATGRSWQDWLDEVLFDPMGMDHTSARTSDFALDELSWSHIWQGEELGWAEITPKTDGMMQSAGGLVTSPDDMITWLQLQLRGEAPEAGITGSMVTTAQTSYVETGMEDGRNAYEMACSGYSLGWNICEFQGFEVHIHGGGYTGARTMMAFSPDAGFGIAAFGNSDNMTGWWTQTAVRMFLQFLADDGNAEQMVELRRNFYQERTARLLDFRQNAIAERNAEEYWEGWNWAPDGDELARYAGEYVSASIPAPAMISVDGDGLVFALGDYVNQLRPARPDLFGGTGEDPFDGADRFDFQRDEAGGIVSFTWNDETFIRQ
ncbi:serine hydrolase domain-containing protein [Hyphobacterium sp.]|uniref:serine hydrolase domain-containing protein n=1 Tax=Hyphobacterium sp. TaxID=2004662 RepID=UPI00374851C6